MEYQAQKVECLLPRITTSDAIKLENWYYNLLLVWPPVETHDKLIMGLIHLMDSGMWPQEVTPFSDLEKTDI